MHNKGFSPSKEHKKATLWWDRPGSADRDLWLWTEIGWNVIMGDNDSGGQCMSIYLYNIVPFPCYNKSNPFKDSSPIIPVRAPFSWWGLFVFGWKCGIIYSNISSSALLSPRYYTQSAELPRQRRFSGGDCFNGNLGFNLIQKHVIINYLFHHYFLLLSLKT